MRSRATHAQRKNERSRFAGVPSYALKAVILSFKLQSTLCHVAASTSPLNLSNQLSKLN